jgi:hypothetical protein
MLIHLAQINVFWDILKDILQKDASVIVDGGPESLRLPHIVAVARNSFFIFPGVKCTLTQGMDT